MDQNILNCLSRTSSEPSLQANTKSRTFSDSGYFLSLQFLVAVWEAGIRPNICIVCHKRLLTDINKCFQQVSQGLWKISKNPLQGSRIWIQSFPAQKETLFSPIFHPSQDANNFYEHVWFMCCGHSETDWALRLLPRLKWPSSGVTEVVHSTWIQMGKRRNLRCPCL